MRLPTWYLAVGIALPLFMFFVIVNPLVDLPFRAFSTAGLPGPRPRLVMLRYSEYEHGPVLAVYNTGEALVGKVAWDRPAAYRHVAIGMGAVGRLLERLDLDSLARLEGSYARYNVSDGARTVLFFWKQGQPHVICVYGDRSPEYPQRVIPDLVDSALAILGRFEPPGLRPWSTADSTLVFWSPGATYAKRTWPAEFPQPGNRYQLASFVAIPGDIAPEVFSFMAGHREGEHFLAWGRAWAVALRLRLPGEAAFIW
jgi:hypothetical protein